ncbi:MAG: molybdopterin-dependent oxidoreductase [Chthoniobacteraceae bacterium]
MSTATATPVQMVNVQIDGVWHQFPKGMRAIEACKQAGKLVPHYCYHPKLTSPGNCRMCLIEMGTPKMTPDRKPVLGADGKPEIGWIPRPQISCAQDVSEGMGIRTDSPMVQECRKGVMEFLLINHPLDCPICDQAGECKLQEFSVEHGNANSRFLERKVKKPKSVELGPRVTLDAERCILCTRCIRFMKEVANDDVLGIVDRGSFNSIACHPDRKLDHNYSLNTVDICPVGALTSTDFRFKMRVWFLRETSTIDVNCGTGSNITIGSRENVIYRITPRENEAVNGPWMPDSHRLNFKFVGDPSRLSQPEIRPQLGEEKPDWTQAINVAAEALKRNAGKVAVLASGRSTNEELFLVKRLAAALKAKIVDILPRTGEADGLLIAADRNPNTTGAKLLGIATGKLGEIAAGIRDGSITALLAIGEDATKVGLTDDDLAKLDAVVALDILPNKTTAKARVVLPASAWCEKRGSMINLKNRIQRLNKAVNAPGAARDDWEILRDLILAISGSNGLHSIEDVFKAMASATPELAGLTLSRIGELGVDLNNREIPSTGHVVPPSLPTL